MVPWQRLVDGKTPRLRKIQPLALDLFVIRQDYCFRLEWSVTTCGRLPPPYEYGNANNGTVTERKEARSNIVTSKSCICSIITLIHPQNPAVSIRPTKSYTEHDTTVEERHMARRSQASSQLSKLQSSEPQPSPLQLLKLQTLPSFKPPPPPQKYTNKHTPYPAAAHHISDNSPVLSS
jgi:hypothetical protein